MQALESVFAGLPAHVNDSAHLQHIGRFCSTDFMLEIDDTPWHFTVREGRLESLEKGPFRMKRWTFALRAPEASWREFWSDIPAPGYNDIFALTAYGHAQIDGDIGPLLTDLRYIKELIALPRGLVDWEQT